MKERAETLKEQEVRIASMLAELQIAKAKEVNANKTTNGKSEGGKCK